MKRTYRNTVAVFVVTLFTAIAIFATVQLVGRVLDPTDTAVARNAASGQVVAPSSSSSSATAGSDSEQLVCPATGCAATSCHAQQ
jgi:hypothetical protein